MASKPICLASQSVSRQEVLNGVQFEFDVKPADIDETNNGESVEEYVSRLAREKGFAVLSGNPSKIIISADSVAELDGEIIGKPTSEEEAISILTKLRGKWHTFVTGLCVIKVEDSSFKQEIVKTRVKLANISDDDLKYYVDKIKPFRFAGGFSNTESSWFIEKIEGSISNLMGLPMSELFTMLKEFKISLGELYTNHEPKSETG